MSVSEARKRLHVSFQFLPLGKHFQLVNTQMGAAMPNTFTLEKVETDPEGCNAKRLDNGKLCRVKIDSLVELTQ